MKGLSTVTITATLVTASAYLLFNRLFNLCMCRGNKLCMCKLVHLDREARAMTTALHREQPDISNWRSATPAENWHITTANGDMLYAKALINNSSDKWAVVVHGYGCDGSLMLYAAKRFYEQGYSVLLPDLYAHGKSSGKYIGWGWRDKTDIQNWCICISHRFPRSKILLYGVSMGAAAVLMAAGENKITNLACVVSDCSYTTLDDILRYRIRRMLHLPPKLVMLLLKPLCKRRAGLSVQSVSVLKHTKNITVPIVFCHGDRDRFVPTDNALELYAVASAPKKLLLVHGAGHGVSAFVGGDKYWNGIFKFTQKFLP